MHACNALGLALYTLNLLPKPNQAHTAAAPPAAAVRNTHDTHTAYRRVCLEHHPDKKLVGVECEEAKSKAEEYFKKIQARCIAL